MANKKTGIHIIYNQNKKIPGSDCVKLHTLGLRVTFGNLARGESRHKGRLRDLADALGMCI